ncbi:hypothetical protein WSM22_27700 [Cytophagales bacterium WSM2-2]|nr:hypothetical protein WSM22_27700 [Cytophagales bacterium WSM2-2]
MISMRFNLCLTLILFQGYFLLAQRDPIVKNKSFQISLAPGLGTNGMQPGSFANKFSINLTSGYSAAASIFEVAAISNLNTDRTGGLQLAGLVNLTGANAFGGLSKKDKDQKIKNGYASLLSGVQVSGLTNIVVDDAHGAQFSGGINIVKGPMLGIQISGVSNIVYKYSFGVQLSGIANASVLSVDGVQISALSNYTKGGLYGLQMSAINQSGEMEGTNSRDNKLPWGVQIGLLNFSGRMNGFQIGLINFAKRSQGTQIGLINIYKKGKTPETKDGTAIGLINVGDLGYAAIYANEIFGLNYEIATGNRKNSRIKLDSRNSYLENVIIYSRQALHSNAWGIGYGLKKMVFNRSDVPGMSESRFASYGIDFQQINMKPGELTKDLSLLTRLNFMLGKRIAPKLFGFNWYAAISLNAYWSNTGNSIATRFLYFHSEYGNSKIEYWAGYSLGILIH